MTTNDTATNGSNGKSCSVNIDEKSAKSIGGFGGIRYYQNQGIVNIYLDFEKHFTHIVDQALGETTTQDYYVGGKDGGYNQREETYDTTSGVTGILSLAYDYLCDALNTITMTTKAKDGWEIFPSGNSGSNGYYWGKKGSSDIQTHTTSKAWVRGSGGLYNYKYSWSDPKGSKFLGYGEAGQPGQFIHNGLYQSFILTSQNNDIYIIIPWDKSPMPYSP